jgi:hypothetical protein
MFSSLIFLNEFNRLTKSDKIRKKNNIEFSEVIVKIYEEKEMGYFSFSTLDYIILLMLLTISGAIGIFYGCFGKTQITSKELLIADRKMGVFPASMSLLAGFLSGASLLGIPSEMYYYGTMYLWTGESDIIIWFYY